MSFVSSLIATLTVSSDGSLNSPTITITARSPNAANINFQPQIIEVFSLPSVLGFQMSGEFSIEFWALTGRPHERIHLQYTYSAHTATTAAANTATTTPNQIPANVGLDWHSISELHHHATAGWQYHADQWQRHIGQHEFKWRAHVHCSRELATFKWRQSVGQLRFQQWRWRLQRSHERFQRWQRFQYSNELCHF